MGKMARRNLALHEVPAAVARAGGGRGSRQAWILKLIGNVESYLGVGMGIVAFSVEACTHRRNNLHLYVL